jgi:hypothetical protein
MVNGNSAISNSNSFGLAAVDDGRVRSMPWLFRVGVPGFQCGWPPR